jgi:hypothetical protein
MNSSMNLDDLRLQSFCEVCNNFVTRFQFVKELRAVLDFKLYFRHNIDYILSQVLKMLGLIPYITSSFSSLSILLVTYNTLVRSKLVFICSLEFQYFY